MNNVNNLFANKGIHFNQKKNEILQNNKLSLKAKGLYALIQNIVSINFQYSLCKTDIEKFCKEGTTSFNRAWNELKQAGYIKQYKLKKADGTFYYRYELL